MCYLCKFELIIGTYSMLEMYRRLFFYSNLLTTHKCPGCYVVPSALTPLSKYMYMSTSNETPLDVMLIPKS